jgi:poly(hydroxyalkanoate) depolymerase family esterase
VVNQSLVTHLSIIARMKSGCSKISKKLTLSFSYLLLLVSQLYAQSLVRVTNFGSNPGNLRMYLYTPANLDSTRPVPLVVVLHGCLQTAKSVSLQTGWNKLADQYGFRVLYPQQRVINNPYRCYCWYQGGDIEKDKGENFSIKQMIDHVKATSHIDSGKVFITGLSAGAAMSVTLMATYPETFNAGAIFSGGPYKAATHIWTGILALNGWRIKSPEKWGDLVREQNPGYAGAYPRMIIYHGRRDVVVNKRNATQIVKQWTNLYHISTEPSETIKRFTRTRDIEKNIYRTVDNKEAVIYYRVKRMGHALLVDPGKCNNKGGRRGLFSADKNYFSTYWTAIDFGLINVSQISGPKTVTLNEKNLTYSVPEKTKVTFRWFVPKGCEIISRIGSNAITINWGKRPGNIDVVEVDSQGCKTQYPSFPVSVTDVK